MIICSIEDFKKICNLSESAKVNDGNYWFIRRSGKNYTVHVDSVSSENITIDGERVVVARITKEEELVGVIAGYMEKRMVMQLKKIGSLIRGDWSGREFDGRDVQRWINLTIEGVNIMKALETVGAY